MARKSITTTGLSRQIHTLYKFDPVKDPYGSVSDWHYHNVPSTHNVFDQAVHTYTNYPKYGSSPNVSMRDIWPRRRDDYLPIHWDGDPTK